MRYTNQNTERRGSKGMAVSQTVVQKPGDPYIYLYVMGEWYCYNPMEPPLGGGAMGTVYKGFCCKDGHPVAIKRVIDNYANNPQIRERAKMEAGLAYRHPNLVEMLGYCEYTPTYGPIFLLSNFVQGEDIDKYVLKFANMPNRVEKISTAICQVLDALDYCHSRGIVHRDVKPSNIMVEDGSNVRLMDLGIARQNGGNQFSSYGFIGTPEYSAPEQVTGNKEQINATTDIYELGITFYELLAGENPMACQSEAETLTKQIKEPLPSSSKIPRKLMNVILKATEKNQALRYQTALDFKKAIQEALIPDPPLGQRISEWFQANFLLAVSIVVLVAVIIFVIILIV